MALRNVFGIVRSDTGLGVNDIWASGNTFSSSLAQTITIDLGADDTIFDGDPSTGNGQPNDTSQTYDDGAGAHAFFYDFSVLVTGSDGETYEVAVFDYDQNDNGNVFDIRDPGVAVEVAENANEGDYFYAFINGSPPPGITLTTTGTFTNTDPFLPVPCFARGTLIDTPAGAVPIEDLKVGSTVRTLDHGHQEIRWVGSRKVSRAEILANPKLRPVCILAGSLGHNLPQNDLWVSRQHRMLVRSQLARWVCGNSEVLVSAIKLGAMPGIYVDELKHEVEYFHILFDEHQVVFANGAPSESLHLGPEALKSLSDHVREEVLTLFPEVADPDFLPSAARQIPNGRLQKRLMERHLLAKEGLISSSG